MRITNESFEISESVIISWGDVKALKLLNDKLALVLSNRRVIELDHLRPSTIDSAFRAFQHYRKDHPEKKEEKTKTHPRRKR